MPALDFFTLHIVVLLNTLTISLIWAAAIYTYRDFQAPRFWLISTALLMASGLILSIYGKQAIGWADIIAFTLSVASIMTAWVGIRRFYGDRNGLRLVFVITFAAFAACYIFYDNLNARRLVYAFGQSVAMALAVIYLLRRPDRGLGDKIAVMAMFMGISGHAVHVAFTLASWIGGYDLSSFAVLETYAFVCVVYCSVVWNFGFIVMAFDHLRREMTILAETDELTGVPNRRHFMHALDNVSREFIKSGRPYSVLLIDLDNFKGWNDTYGHAVGDFALQHFAKTAQGTLRQEYVVARTGGDEFCALLPGTSLDGAMRAAERIVMAVRRAPLIVESKEVGMTVSIGVASRNATDMDDTDILARADAALYKLKKAGRNGYASETEVFNGTNELAVSDR